MVFELQPVYFARCGPSTQSKPLIEAEPDLVVGAQQELSRPGRFSVHPESVTLRDPSPPKCSPSGESWCLDDAAGTPEESDTSVFLAGCACDCDDSVSVGSTSSLMKHALQQNPSLNFSATSSSSFSPIHLECIQVPQTSHASMRSPSSSVALVNQQSRCCKRVRGVMKNA
eukprot:COSAG02_NODE_3545_length_6583_cov_2.896823_2_plen_171_part_00